MVLASAKRRGTVADVPRLAPRIHDAVLDLVDLLVDIAHCEDGDQGGEDDDAGLDGLRATRRCCRAGGVISKEDERKTKSDGSNRTLLTSAILVVLRHTDVHDCKLLGKRQNGRSEVDPHVHPAQGEDRRRDCRTRPSISIIAH